MSNSIASTQNQVFQPSGSVVPYNSDYILNVIGASGTGIIANTTLASNQCPCLVNLGSATAGAYTLTLPAPFVGGYIRCVMTVNNATNAITIACGATTVYGTATCLSTGYVLGGHANIILSAGVVKGDWAEFVSDGTLWYVRAQSAITTNSITAS